MNTEMPIFIGLYIEKHVKGMLWWKKIDRHVVARFEYWGQFRWFDYDYDPDLPSYWAVDEETLAKGLINLAPNGVNPSPAWHAEYVKAREAWDYYNDHVINLPEYTYEFGLGRPEGKILTK